MHPISQPANHYSQDTRKYDLQETVSPETSSLREAERVGVICVIFLRTNTYFFKFNIHGTVHRSMTSSNNQRDAA